MWYLWQRVLYLKRDGTVYGCIGWWRIPKRYYKTEWAAKQALEHFTLWAQKYCDSVHLNEFTVLPKDTTPTNEITE